jgi:2-polyprenyl-3-methyl-5-hydroxy-6-metoxy-1,4-benzoquinol methylase
MGFLRGRANAGSGPTYSAEDVVRACYRIFLHREPESADVVRRQSRRAPGELISSILDSPEALLHTPPQIKANFVRPLQPVQVEVSQDQLDAMFQRIREEWSKFGETDPYWSVMTNPAYRSDRIDEATLEHFYETGREHADLIDLVGQRSGDAPRRNGVCFELGCGAGRITRYLAERFDRVVGVDVSPGNLRLAEESLQRRGVKNVETRLIDDPVQFEDIPAFDFFYSLIVLQHNPPPVQAYILDRCLSKLRPGGAFLFQTPTHTPGYAFDAQAYLESKSPGMEMHCLPMPSVLRLLSNHGLQPLEVLMDPHTGMYGSHVFYGVKDA